MSRPRSSDPLTAATSSFLIPSLRPMGFLRKTNRSIARLSNEIIQFIDLQISAWGSKDFCVPYASLSLFLPRDYLILQTGDRLHRDSEGEWFPAATHEEADSSMQEVATLAMDQAVPFFERTSSIDGLLKLFENEQWGSRHHLELEMAACAAKLGMLDRAGKHLDSAISLYREDGRSWCQRYIDLCKELRAAIEGNGPDELLKGWLEHSVKTLRLEKLISIS